MFSKYADVEYELNDSASVKITYCDKKTYIFAFWTILAIEIISIIEIIFTFFVFLTGFLNKLYERRQLNK